MEYIINASGAIFHGEKKKWIIIKRGLNEEHAAGELSLVGGKVEGYLHSNYLLENNLKREIREEIGIEIKENIIYLNSSGFKIGRKNVININFLCWHESGVAIAFNKKEVDEIFYMTKKDILDNKNSPSYLKEAIILADNYKKTISY